MSGRWWQIKIEPEGTGTSKWFEGLLIEGKKYQLRGRTHNRLTRDRCEMAKVNFKQEARTYSAVWRLLVDVFRGSHGPVSYG